MSINTECSDILIIYNNKDSISDIKTAKCYCF